MAGKLAGSVLGPFLLGRFRALAGPAGPADPRRNIKGGTLPTNLTKKRGDVAEITITASGLASGSARQSAAYVPAEPIDDVEIRIRTQTASGTLGANPEVRVFLPASVDGTNYDGTGVTGLDAPISIANPTNFRMADAIQTPTAATPYEKTFSVKAVLGFLPAAFSVVLENGTGLALGTTTVQAVPVYYQSL